MSLSNGSKFRADLNQSVMMSVFSYMHYVIGFDEKICQELSELANRLNLFAVPCVIPTSHICNEKNVKLLLHNYKPNLLTFSLYMKYQTMC